MRNSVTSGFRAPVSRREMSSTAPRISSTDFKRLVDVRDEAGGLGVGGALDEGCRVEPRGVERLQDVVAGGGQKARLAEIGLVGGRLWPSPARRWPRRAPRCARVRAAPAISLARARARSPSTRSVMSVAGHHDAAVRHGAGADFEHRSGRLERLLDGREAAHELVEPVGDDGLRAAGSVEAAVGVEAQDVGQRRADLAELGRQVEQVAELPVPADQAEIRRRTRRCPAPPGRARSAAGRGCTGSPPRRRRAASCAALVVGSLRLNSSDRTSRDEDAPTALASSCSEKRTRSRLAGVVRTEPGRVLASKRGEGALGPLLAEIARDRAAQVVDGDGGAPAPEEGSARELRSGTKIAAWARSIGLGARISETKTRATVLSDRLQNTPWVSGSKAMPNSACGRSQPMPNGPFSSKRAGRCPASASDGRSSV